MEDFCSRPISIQTDRSRFSLRQSHRSTIGKELNNYSILDEQKLQILLLCTDLKDKQRSKHIIDSAVALENTGHKYQFDLVSHRVPASKVSFKWSWFIARCLRQADQVLVPNKVFYNIYFRCFHTKVTPTICEPYLNVRQLKKEPLLLLSQVLDDVTDENLIFLVLAEYHPRSNLELALDAFHLLLHTSDHAAHVRLKLVVAGHAGRGRTAYVRRLAMRVRRLHLDTRVLLHPRPSKQHKKALLTGCLALVSCQEHGLWDRYVLEAMALGRPVIATDTGFTSEVLDNGVTGYVIPATPDSFCAAMGDIIYNTGKGEFIGKMAQCDFIKKYSLEAYSARLNKILSDLKEENQNTTCSAEIVLQNRELFFG